MHTLRVPRSINRRRAVRQVVGRVSALQDDKVVVETRRTLFRAARAVSCLVAPEVGDVVLAARCRGGESYVLAVLQRSGEGPTRIEADGDLTVELRKGRFTVAAAEGVCLVSRATVSLAADRIEGHAREGMLLIGSLDLIANSVSAVFDRLLQTAKRVFRRVDEIEHVRAGHIDVASEGALRLHGENTLITARDLVKANGSQIHLG